MHSWFDVRVEEHGPGTRNIACGPFLCINLRCRPGYLWIDRSSVQEEPAICSSAVPPVVHVPVVRPVVVSWLGSDVPVASGARGPVSYLSTPVEVSHPHVDLSLSNVPGGLGHKKEFDDSLLRFYGYLGNGRQLFPPHRLLYNKYVGGKFREGHDCLTYGPICLRNIRVGKPVCCRRFACWWGVAIRDPYVCSELGWSQNKHTWLVCTYRRWPS